MKISTLTLNPAIDLFIDVNELKPVIVNRTNFEDYQANGKAINISFILKQMGLNSKALGFLGGFTGEFIEKELHAKGIETDFVKIDGITRINVFINAEEEYRIVNKGPQISENSQAKMLKKIEELEENSYLFVSGSLPKGIEEEIFVEIAKISQKKNIKLVYDISSKKLLETLKYSPYLIKPNEEELAYFFEDNDELNDEKIIYYSQQLIKKGAQNVLVTRGEKGSYLCTGNEVFKVSALNGKVVNTACAGDTLLGSFVGSLIKGKNITESLKYASVAGSLTAFSPGLGNMNEVEKYLNSVNAEFICTW